MFALRLFRLLHLSGLHVPNGELRLLDGLGSIRWNPSYDDVVASLVCQRLAQKDFIMPFRLLISDDRAAMGIIRYLCQADLCQFESASEQLERLRLQSAESNTIVFRDLVDVADRDDQSAKCRPGCSWVWFYPPMPWMGNKKVALQRHRRVNFVCEYFKLGAVVPVSIA